MNTPGASGAKGAPQGLKVPLTGSESQDLLKPLVFGNHQKQFKIFSAVVSAAMTYYLVFHHDFGPKRHVFSWLREWRERTMKVIFYIDPSDIEVQRMKEMRKAKAPSEKKPNTEHDGSQAAELTPPQHQGSELRDSR